MKAVKHVEVVLRGSCDYGFFISGRVIFSDVMRFLMIAVFFILFMYQGKSEKISCYCNFQECVLNNYQCSYEDGGCFSDFLDYRDITQAKHGCLYLLKKEKQEQCGHSPGSSSPRSLLLCCKTDMCNQVLSPASLFTHSIIGSLISASEVQNFERNENQYQRHSNTNEVWFKAATIAVPICGAMILFLLVALAFKILRADHVNVQKYCGKTKSNACFTGTHAAGFKAAELNSKDFYKKIPLLYETQPDEVQNYESSRNYTSVRIHFGQNVNKLKDSQDVGKVEKNLENEKMNLDKSRALQSDVPTTSSVHSDETNNNVLSVEFNTSSTLDLRKEDEEQMNLPIFSLNLDKWENLNSCNVYRNSKSEELCSATNSVTAELNKVCDKYLL